MRPLALLVTAAAVAMLSAGCQSTSAPATTPTPTAKAAPPPPPSPTFEPGPGIRCDRRSQVCRFGETASPALTRLYLGDGAAQRLTAPPAADPATGVATGVAAAPPAQAVADPIFKPSPWQSCDTLVTSCYDIDGANVELTRQRFGDKAAVQLQAREARPVEGSRVVRYGETITCDQLAQVCYDRLGAGYGITLLYLGEPEAARLLERLQASGDGPA